MCVFKKPSVNVKDGILGGFFKELAHVDMLDCETVLRDMINSSHAYQRRLDEAVA